jgi:NAD(P)-dependent dehydrogenase (short-subunit alcohol dehydrogenase family)
VSWELGLEDRGVIITGGAGGIGPAITIAFASAGARTAVVDVDPARSEEVVAGLDEPERHLAIGTDLTELDGHDGVLRGALETFGRLDVLAHWRRCCAASRRSTT